MKNIAIFVTMICLLVCGKSLSECDKTTYYILCNPESYTTIRSKPNKHSEMVGYLYCGDKIEADYQKNGWLHCSDMSIELGYGYVSKNYVVSSEVTVCDPTEYTVVSNGRVFLRKYVGDKSSKDKTVRNGDIVIIIAYSDEWAVTNESRYIMTKFLDIDNMN